MTAEKTLVPHVFDAMRRRLNAKGLSTEDKAKIAVAVIVIDPQLSYKVKAEEYHLRKGARLTVAEALGISTVKGIVACLKEERVLTATNPTNKTLDCLKPTATHRRLINLVLKHK